MTCCRKYEFSLLIIQIIMEVGINHLTSVCEAHGLTSKTLKKGVIIPIFSFIDLLNTSLREYTNRSHLTTWAEFIAEENQNEQFMANIISSWHKHKSNSLQCQLLGTLLNIRNPSKLKEFLKLRKAIMKVSTKKTLDQTTLLHEDVLGITHRLYKNPQTRRTITDGIKKLFISYKMTQAKLYSCVFIQYVLSTYDKIYSRFQTEAEVSKTRNQQSQGQIQNFFSSIHQDNGLYRKTTPSVARSHCYAIIDQKFTQFHDSKERIKPTKSPVVRKHQPQTPIKSSYETLIEKWQQRVKQQDEQIPIEREEPFSAKLPHRTEIPSEKKIPDERYTTWVEMIDKNKSFKEKMLKSQDNFESKSFHVLHDTVSKQWE